MDGIRYWKETAGVGHWFFIAFPVVLICLLIWFKGRRDRFLIPSILISLVIINPLFYKKWEELGLYAYWRILWVVPVIPIVACLVPSISERIQKGWIKAIVAVVGVGLIVFGGTFLYNGVGGSFVEAANASKLPDYVVQIADRLLELDEHPKIIAQDPIGVYIRQYTGEIDTLFGRDLYGYMTWRASADGTTIHNEISNPDSNLSIVSQFMLDNGYDYLVLTDVRETTGFKLIDRIGQCSIYKAVGMPKVRKERNDQGQIIAITTLDENGKPANGINDYSTVLYTYDEDGFIVRELHLDVSGKCLGGFERIIDSKSHLIMKRNLDNESKPYLQIGGFYGYTQTFDEKGTLISRTYVDEGGNPIQRTDGYSTVMWSNGENGNQTVRFFDIENSEIEIEGLNLVKDIEFLNDGWSEWMMPTYNEDNISVYLGTVNLGEKQAGDVYCCQLEIEFRNVQGTENRPFRICTQGSVDGSWEIKNVWSTRLMDINAPPNDEIYTFSIASSLDERMSEASNFLLCFRCDYWKSGMFRVRKVKVEKGNSSTEWTPGL